MAALISILISPFIVYYSSCVIVLYGATFFEMTYTVWQVFAAQCMFSLFMGTRGSWLGPISNDPETEQVKPIMIALSLLLAAAYSHMIYWIIT